MNRTRLSSIDIAGITLGAIAFLIVVGSLVGLIRQRTFGFPPWEGGPMFSIGGAVREEKDDQVPGTFTELEIRNIAGSIDIRGSDASSGVAIHSVKTAPFQGALDNVRVDIQQRGNRLVVEERHDRGFVFRTGTVSFQVAIPKGMKVVEAHSVSGSIAVHDVESGIDQTLSSVSGSIATSVARNLDASSTSGGIEFAFAGDRLKAHSVSGSISGEIRSLDPSGRADLSTVSGSVTVNAFAGLDATVSLHSLSGRVSCDFPVLVAEQKNNRLRGKIGAGSASLDAGTTSGSIAINKM